MPTSQDLTLTTSLVDSSLLNGANGITSQTLNGRTFLYVTSEFSDTLTVYEAFSDGTVSFLSRFDGNNGASAFLSNPSGLATTVVGGDIYVYLGTSSGDDLRVLRQETDGTLTEVQFIDDSDDAAFELDNNFGEFTVAEVGGNQFLVVHGFNDDGISIFQIGNTGQLTNVFNIDDSAALGLGLNGAYDTTIARVGSTTFLLATGNVEDALTIFEMTAAGGLILRSSFADAGDLNLNGASSVAAVTLGGTTYVYVAGNIDDGISIFSLDATGTATNLFNLSDPLLDGIRDIDVFTFDGTTYLAATAPNEDALITYEIGSDGNLTLADSVVDTNDPNLFLNAIHEATFFEIAGQGFIAVTSEADDSLSVFQIGGNTDPIEGTGGRDVLVGGARDDTINGRGGDDVILGLDGNDSLNGNLGDDLINGGAGDDVIIGDNTQSQTASDVVTITETGQDLALSVTLPDTNDTSTIEISGLINRQPVQDDGFNIVYVIDVSGSMSSPFVGSETVGDLNGDGSSNTLLDGTIAAFQSLNGSLVQAGFGSADASIVLFDSNASILFEGSALVGVDNALSGLRTGGSTNFEAALQQTIAALTNAGPGENVVYFLSDGGNNAGGSFADEVMTLLDPNGLDATINSIGLGSTAVLPDLDLVDDGIANDSATRVLTPSTLTATLTGSPVETSEVDRLEIYVNGVLQRTLDDTEFAVTPLGLRYDLVVDGLSTSAGDVIDVVLVASDGAETEVSVSLTVPNGVQEVGDDVLIGGTGDDRIEGAGGDDDLLGGQGNDGLVGGSGNDLLDGGDGRDLLLGGSGNDTLIGSGGADTLQGGAGNDVYFTGNLDVVDESGGTAADFDTIVSHLSIDLGAARFIGSFEGARLIGTADTDATGNAVGNRLEGNAFDNVLRGLDGNDTMFGGLGNDLIFGGNQSDEIFAGGGNDTVAGGNGRDNVVLGNGNDIFNDNAQGGDAGRDTVDAGAGNDTINGGAGNDQFAGGDGNDLINGGAGFDLIFGGNQSDTVNAGNGNDTVFGGNGQDEVRLGLGNDVFNDNTQGGAAGADTVFAGNGFDTINGGAGADLFFGGNGNDSIFGGLGFDTLAGGAGADTLTGGGGADTFDFVAADAGTGVDLVTDFVLGVDILRLTGTTAGAVSVGYDGMSNTVTVSVSGTEAFRLQGPGDLSTFDAGDIVFV